MKSEHVSSVYNSLDDCVCAAAPMPSPKKAPAPAPAKTGRHLLGEHHSTNHVSYNVLKHLLVVDGLK